MANYRIIFDGELQDEVFDTEEAAEDCALYLCSFARDGAETLRLSNPGDYDYDGDDYEDPEYEIHRGGGLNRPCPVRSGSTRTPLLTGILFIKQTVFVCQFSVFGEQTDRPTVLTLIKTEHPAA